MALDEVLAATFSLVAPHLTERQRRLLPGAAAQAMGYGGVSRVARLAQASRPTVRRGAAELDQPTDPRGRVRQHDGPKRRRDTDPGLLQALDRLVDPDTPRRPAEPVALDVASPPVSWPRRSPGRGMRQRRHCGAKVHLADGQPVVSVDTKKKELVGRFANGGREWQPSGSPEGVNVHDFPDPKVRKAIPYGVYDLGRNRRGRPLRSHEVIVELIGATTTHTALRVRAELDHGRYPLGVKVPDEELAAVPLVRHEFHGEWNYTIQPAA